MTKPLKRPTYLTILLILMTILSIYSITQYLTLKEESVTFSYPGLGPIPQGILFVYIGNALLQLIGILLLWKWKKLGFYTIIAITGFSIVLHFITYGMLAVISIFFGFLNIAALYFCMQPVWKKFK